VVLGVRDLLGGLGSDCVPEMSEECVIVADCVGLSYLVKLPQMLEQLHKYAFLQYGETHGVAHDVKKRNVHS
jgi:hypothetical protein